MHIDGMSSKEIYAKIKIQGYMGSESLIRKFITDFRSETIEGNEAVDIRYVEKNVLISLLYKPIEKVFYTSIKNKYNTLDDLFDNYNDDSQKLIENLLSHNNDYFDPIGGDIE